MNGISFILTNRDYALLFAAIVAAVCFFTGYPSQDPRSAVEIRSDQNTIEQKAIHKLTQLGFSTDNYTSQVSFKSEDQLLDSLQYGLGRAKAVDILKNSRPVNLKPYYWEVSFYKSSSDHTITIGKSSEESDPPLDTGGDLTVRLDGRGNVIGLNNNADQIPDNPVRRKALKKIFSDSTVLSADSLILPSIVDSLLDRILLFDSREPSNDSLDNQLNSFQSRVKNKTQYRFSDKETKLLAVYYLQNFNWDIANLTLDSVFTEQIKSADIASVLFKSKEPELGQDMSLIVRVTPAGRLVSLQASYNTRSPSSTDWNDLWGILHVVLIFLFGLGGLIIFFYRIRARAVDTRSALVVAILTGLAVTIYILLDSMQDVDMINNSSEWVGSILLIVRMGISGALTSLGFFILFSISDSITRQYWPEKLGSYDYLRRGMIFNKPIGLVVVRSVLLALILAGIWTAALWIFPNLYFKVDTILFKNMVSWPPLYVFLKTGTYGFLIILVIFLTVGSQTYAQAGNTWLVALSTTLACAIIVPLLSSYGPSIQEFVIAAIFGIFLTLVYLKWDFLTVFLSYFLFLILLKSVSGWIIHNSPDLPLFISVLVFLVLLLIAGFMALLKGKEEQALLRYVPEYVEELAHEERIKQELEIAREVQQSFLPEETPNIEGLDIAALCQPAFETGGDYYDFIHLDDHRVAVTIGDVSGKGIQAAFYMTFTKGILHSLCRETDSPAELLTKANRLFCDNAGKGTFISLVYGIIDLKQCTFTFARGGHNPIIRINTANSTIEELQPTGLGLGLTKESLFKNSIREVKLFLTKDDILVLYTDGIVEALNEAHKFYGNKRLVKLLKMQMNGTSEKILRELFHDVTRFAGKARQHDDMTIMVIKLT